MAENKGKVVLITGCSSGFGYLTALTFARTGWITFASMRDIEGTGARELQEIKRKENLLLELIKIDVTDEKSVKEGVETVTRRAGRVDVLVNNAGFGYLGPVEDFSIDEVKSQFETNVFGTLRMVKAIVSVMREQGSGKIINISSINGLISFPFFGVYSSSKFALEALSTSLRFELSHFGIKVVLVEPGSFITNFSINKKHPKKFGSSAYEALTKKFFQRYSSVSSKAGRGVISRFTHPQRVADLIYKIALEKSPKSRYLIGFDAHVYYWLKKLLPYSVWERLLHKVYNW